VERKLFFCHEYRHQTFGGQEQLRASQRAALLGGIRCKKSVDVCELKQMEAYDLTRPLGHFSESIFGAGTPSDTYKQ
jgi:hypothetical protein